MTLIGIYIYILTSKSLEHFPCTRLVPVAFNDSEVFKSTLRHPVATLWVLDQAVLARTNLAASMAAPESPIGGHTLVLSMAHMSHNLRTVLGRDLTWGHPLEVESNLDVSQESKPDGKT